MAELPSGLSKDQKNLYLFMRAATWPDTIKHEWLKDSDTPPANITTNVNIGFTDTAGHGYWHFIDVAFASDNSTLPPTPVPNAVTQIAALRAAIASKEPNLLKSYDLVGWSTWSATFIDLCMARPATMQIERPGREPGGY